MKTKISPLRRTVIAVAYVAATPVVLTMVLTAILLGLKNEAVECWKLSQRNRRA